MGEKIYERINLLIWSIISLLYTPDCWKSSIVELSDSSNFSGKRKLLATIWYAPEMIPAKIPIATMKPRHWVYV